MTIRVSSLIALLTAAYACAQTPVAVPLTKSCGSEAEAVATLRASDHVHVRYSFAGDAGTCYAVTATIDGTSVDGYLIGAAHPDIAAFEHEVRTQAVLIPPPPPPPPAAPATPAIAAKPPAGGPTAKESASVAKPITDAAKPTVEAAPLSFAGFRAVAIDGWPVDLSRERAANVFIYFWSARSRASIRAVDLVESIYNTYYGRGVYVVGVGAAASLDQLKTAAAENELGGKQVLDRGGLAARYHVDPTKPFMVLDESRNVIAAASTAQALEPILSELTKNRRSRP
jgi:hypothetical protein